MLSVPRRQAEGEHLRRGAKSRGGGYIYTIHIFNSMTDDLIQKITKEIDNCGFPLEINSSVILQKNQWYVQNNCYYYDRLSEIHREIDLIARKSKKTKGYEDMLIIECKKSKDDPWVFLKQSHYIDILCMNIVHYEKNSTLLRIPTA